MINKMFVHTKEEDYLKLSGVYSLYYLVTSHNFFCSGINKVSGEMEHGKLEVRDLGEGDTSVWFVRSERGLDTKNTYKETMIVICYADKRYVIYDEKFTGIEINNIPIKRIWTKEHRFEYLQNTNRPFKNTIPLTNKTMGEYNEFQQPTAQDIRKFARLSKMKDPQKTFTELGIVNGSGKLIQDEMFIEWLWEKFKDSFYEELIKPYMESKKEKKKEKK